MAVNETSTSIKNQRSIFGVLTFGLIFIAADNQEVFSFFDSFVRLKLDLRLMKSMRGKMKMSGREDEIVGHFQSIEFTTAKIIIGLVHDAHDDAH